MVGEPFMKHFTFGLNGFLVAAVLAGVGGDYLLRPGPLGLNVTILCVAVLGVVAFEAARRGLLRDASARVTLSAAVGFSLLYCVRDTAPTSLLVLAVIGASTVLTAAARLGRDPRFAYLWNYAEDAFNFGIWAIRLPFTLMFRTQEAVKAADRPVSATTFAVLRGVLIAAPLMLVLGLLLVSADALFEQFLTEMFDFDFETVLSHVILFAVCAWAAASIWWQCLEGPVGNTVYGVPSHTTFRPRTIEINVALGLITALFVSFIAVQARYFFGGHERVLTEAGLSYADYARRGFFELAAVAGISLALLVVCSRLLEAAGPRGRLVYRLIAGTFIVSVLIIVASAFHRMSLYIDAYGLTRLRLYTASFMIWTGAVFLWLYFCIHRDRLRRFAWGLLLSGYVATAVLLGMNPDALIARVNMERAVEGKSLDLDYMRTLSLDAVPPIIRAMPRLDEPARASVHSFLDTRLTELETRAARTWTLGMMRASAAAESIEESTNPQ